MPEWSKGQELVQYLAQLEGQEYAVVDRDGAVTGLLRQSAVLGAITGKYPAERENQGAEPVELLVGREISGPHAQEPVTAGTSPATQPSTQLYRSEEHLHEQRHCRQHHHRHHRRDRCRDAAADRSARASGSSSRTSAAA